MADRPILFSAPMVRALLLGNKTQTRRVMNPQPPAWIYPDARPGYSCLTPAGHIEFRGRYIDSAGVDHGPASKFMKLPFLKDDRLWVKETWFAESWYDRHKAEDRPAIIARIGEPKIWYDAGYLGGLFNPMIMRTSPLDLDAQWSKGRKRVSIHMPRFASRITLPVTEVRVERLQDCSEQDAMAEGIAPHPNGSGAYFVKLDEGTCLAADTAVGVYRMLWDHINGAGAWAENPWVTATTFEVHLSNIDKLPRMEKR